jgi:hypothetical protein
MSKITFCLCWPAIGISLAYFRRNFEPALLILTLKQIHLFFKSKLGIQRTPSLWIFAPFVQRE